ncbi:MAG: DUF4089 domain-containing protein [Acidobacteria bacterium]|nr:DUF4089 domain-containing protein [Acidobacteriota bacterium]
MQADPNQVTTEMIRSLALANGLNIPEDRLEIVLEQYKAFLESVALLNAFPLDREAEPATTFSLTQEDAPGQPPERR